VIIYCKCENNEQISESSREAISEFLANSSLDYVEVSDLCVHAALSTSFFDKITRNSSLTIIACFPRSIQSLFKFAGIDLQGKQITFLNMRELHADEIISTISGMIGEKTGKTYEIPEEDKRMSWYPVIDYDLCTNCGQCMDFCLFGVYERMADKSIKVVKPENCKDNCPACARICPHVAIIFPKLKEKPINGAEIIDTPDQKHVQLDIKDMLGDDVYTALAARKKRAKKKLLKSCDCEKAKSERAACSCKL